MTSHGWFWASFLALFLVVFVVDMYVTGHRKRSLTPRAALRWTALWMGVALAYAAAIYLLYPQAPGSTARTGTQVMLKFVSGYLTEYSLSVDNLFVFLMIFSMMGVSERLQPTLLKAGILLSIVLRVVFIAAGMGIVQRFHWVMYGFGAILLWTAYKMAFTNDERGNGSPAQRPLPGRLAVAARRPGPGRAALLLADRRQAPRHGHVSRLPGDRVHGRALRRRLDSGHHRRHP